MITVCWGNDTTDKGSDKRLTVGDAERQQVTEKKEKKNYL